MKELEIEPIKENFKTHSLTLGEKIRHFRTIKCLSQDDLARKMRGDFDRSMISKWEHNESIPDSLVMFDLADALGISSEELRPGVMKVKELKADKESNEKISTEDMLRKITMELEIDFSSKIKKSINDMRPFDDNILGGFVTIDRQLLEKLLGGDCECLMGFEFIPVLASEFKKLGYIVAEIFVQDYEYCYFRVFLGNDRSTIEKFFEDLGDVLVNYFFKKVSPSSLEILEECRKLWDDYHAAIDNCINLATTGSSEKPKYEVSMIFDAFAGTVVEQVDFKTNSVSEIKKYIEKTHPSMFEIRGDGFAGGYSSFNSLNKIISILKSDKTPRFHVYGLNSNGDEYEDVCEEYACTEDEFMAILNNLKCEAVQFIDSDHPKFSNNVYELSSLKEALISKAE